jgi:glutathione S-transferase
VLAKHLERRETLLCDDFSVADAYLVWALMLTPHAGISLEPYPALGRYLRVHSVRPSVAGAVAFERAERDRDPHSAPGAQRAPGA